MLNWQLKRFDELDINSLYALLKLRCDVCVVEQNCPYPDLDDLDQGSLHLLGWKDAELAAYLRIFVYDKAANEVKIGRVVTSEAARGQGFGYELMRHGVEAAETHFSTYNIRISAQYHLREFYQSFGFTIVSDVYQEDGIPHVALLKQAISTEK